MGKIIETSEQLKPDKTYILGKGYSSIEEAKQYAKTLRIKPMKIVKLSNGYAITKKGKDMFIGDLIFGSVEEL